MKPKFKILGFPLLVLANLIVMSQGSAFGAQLSQKHLQNAEASHNFTLQSTLNSKARVNGQYVLLDDMFTNTGENGNIPVAYAPAAGKKAIFDARWLYKVARKYKLNWAPLSNRVQIVVERISQRISKDVIEAEIMMALADLGADPDLKINLRNRSLRLYVPGDEQVEIGIENAAYNERNHRFSVVVVAPANEPSAQRIRVTGRLERMTEIPVFNRRILSNQIIRERDINWINVRSNRLQRNTITDASDLIGKSPRRGIREGVPIRVSMVRYPVLVKKGSLVTISLKSGLMSLTSKGKALQNGSSGDAIRILNTKSNAIIEAEVIGPGRVAVYLSRPVLLPVSRQVAMN